MSKLLIRFSQSPFGNALAQDGLDFALAATNYGHEVAVLFEGDGVFQLMDSKNHPSTFAKRLSVMPMFDIEECYVCMKSLENLNVSPSEKLLQSLELQQLDTLGKLDLFESVTHTVTF
ncbi:DsrE family protein [Alteromonas sp. KUL49]|uniref:DsrE family protein n=1 Tax=Alteromonas sp. KUL49 TaxID=2480798 RepID=UPI00102F0A1B|nr:DsrE family protein [Alteromonas sp. KUL49]TAP40760.1 sulfur reduction protein DsrE [Alteromonas sp. KUL49]GEA10929.1 protein TusC [Alteromonas sp. KUL49]